jgi:hypothetical protein
MLLRPAVSDASLQALAEWRGRLLIAIDYGETRPAYQSAHCRRPDCPRRRGSAQPTSGLPGNTGR